MNRTSKLRTHSGSRKASLSRRISHRISRCDSVVSFAGSAFHIQQKSHEELDIEIQSARILYVLDELIAKLDIISVLPALIESNARLLYKHLSKKDADFVHEACQQYTFAPEEMDSSGNTDSVSIQSGSVRMSYKAIGQATMEQFDQRSKLDQPKERNVSSIRDSRPDITIQQAIGIIYANENLKNALRDLHDLKRDELTLELIDGMRRLRAIAVQKLEVTANEERERERELRKAWKENAETTNLIRNITEKLNKQKEELDVQLNAKNEQINAYNEKIEALKSKFKEDIKKRINDSEKSMIQKTQLSEEIQAELQQESKEVVHNYWTLLDQHLATEKLLRTKKMKIEAQLANWLAKYDQDIGDRQAELEELQRLYEEETEELNVLQKKFDEQEEEYTELMAERDEYERRIYEEKAYVFLMNKSARIIQRCWRAYRERRRLRKKARKARKKEKGSASESGGDSAKKGAKGKDKKGKKGKKELLNLDDDPMAKLESKFKGDILEDINADQQIPTNVTVDL